MSKYNVTLLAIITIVAPLLSPITAQGTVDTVTPINQSFISCDVIDNNWKSYGQQILGANTKVSDVVLNACAAVGGGCSYASGYRSPEHNRRVGGAKYSRHMKAEAIDLSISEDKRLQLVTLLMCGLGKVNNCNGGIGVYSGGSIHVDVRQGRGIWSNSYTGSDIDTNVRDPNIRNAMYSFAKGTCGGVIAIDGDYSETNLYGPVDNTQPYQYDSNPYSAPPQAYDAYQAPQGSYGYPPQPTYVAQPYTPAQYSGIYGDQFIPPTSQFDQLIADNPDDYYLPTDDGNYPNENTSTTTTTIPTTINTGYTNSNILPPTGTQTVSLINPIGGANTIPTQNIETFPINPDSAYSPSATPTSSQQYGNYMIPTEGPEEAWLTQVPYNTSSDNLPTFIPFYGQEPDDTPDPYDLYAQSQDTPDWVDNSFNDVPQQRSWWQKLIGIFGF